MDYVARVAPGHESFRDPLREDKVLAGSACATKQHTQMCVKRRGKSLLPLPMKDSSVFATLLLLKGLIRVSEPGYHAKRDAGQGLLLASNSYLLVSRYVQTDSEPFAKPRSHFVYPDTLQSSLSIIGR